MNTKTLLENYYGGLHQKHGWEAALAADFRFVGGDMTKPEPVVGRDAYVAVIVRFSRLFTAVRVDRMLVDGDQAAVYATYDYRFPSGVTLTGSVAEFWKAEGDQLAELTIFFDTLSFARLTGT